MYRAGIQVLELLRAGKKTVNMAKKNLKEKKYLQNGLKRAIQELLGN
jgi:hypothetical protein